MQLIRILFCLSALLVASGCIANVISSSVQSSVVYFVAKHDEKVQKKTKRYTVLDKCQIEGTPEAYELGNNMLELNDKPTTKYDPLLSRTVDEVEPAKPIHLAYAFYIIADGLHDNRAKLQINSMEKQIPPKEAEEIRQIIKDKYLISYLDKCFNVPPPYKIARTTRELIMESRNTEVQ